MESEDEFKQFRTDSGLEDKREIARQINGLIQVSRQCGATSTVLSWEEKDGGYFLMHMQRPIQKHPLPTHAKGPE